MIPCCCQNCILSTDDFTRSDSDSPGGNWTESSGDWDIASNALVTSSASGLLLNSTTMPGGVGRIEVTIRSATSGAQAKAIGCYVDTDNYWYARFTFGATNGTLTLWRREGGVETQRAASSTLTGGAVNTDIRLIFCWTGEYVKAQATVGVASSAAAWLTTDTGDCALGTGTTGGSVTFDNVSIESNEDEQNGCDECLACIVVWIDNFGSDSLAADYSVQSGTWTYNGGGYLTVATATLGVVLANENMPTGKGIVSGSLTYAAAYSAFVVGAYADSNNFIYGGFYGNNTGFQRQLQLWQRSGGTDTMLASADLGLQTGASTTANVRLCWNGTIARVFSSPTAIEASCTLTGDGFGFGSISAVTNFNRFDNLSATVLDPDVDNNTEICGCVSEA